MENNKKDTYENMNNDEFDEEVQFEDDYDFDFEFDELNTGIKAIDMAYFSDKRVKDIIEPFFKAIDFMKSHTNLPQDVIIDRINQNVRYLELVNGFENNPTGVGYVDGMLQGIVINYKYFEEHQENIYEFLRHEMTHMMGNLTIKKFFNKNLFLISGYEREELDIKKDRETENTSFNEAAVEMFGYQDEEYREEKIFGEIPINTNQDFNGGLYCVNSNLIHQMLLARGIDKQEFFEGLYDYKMSQRNIRKFPKKLFRRLSKNMDRITADINGYYDADYEIYEMEQQGEICSFEEQKEKMNFHKKDFEKTVSASERVIIDKLLVPRLKRVPANERQAILDEYFKHIVCEKDYFKSRTGYQSVEHVKKDKAPWFKHIDIEPVNIEKQQDMDIEKIDKQHDGENR